MKKERKVVLSCSCEKLLMFVRKRKRKKDLLSLADRFSFFWHALNSLIKSTARRRYLQVTFVARNILFLSSARKLYTNSLFSQVDFDIFRNFQLCVRRQRRYLDIADRKKAVPYETLTHLFEAATAIFFIWRTVTEFTATLILTSR